MPGRRQGVLAAICHPRAGLPTDPPPGCCPGLLQEVEGGMAQAISRLARASSAPHEATVPPLHASRTGLTGAWVASGGRFNSSEVLEGVEEGLE